MMGREPQRQPSLFYTRFNLEQRISPNHPLRAIDRIIDFDFIYDEVRDAYGHNGNVSVPPPVILNIFLQRIPMLRWCASLTSPGVTSVAVMTSVFSSTARWIL